jgi:hypothetical protein
MATKNNKKTKFYDSNPIEAALRDSFDGVINTVKDDLLEESISSAWQQLLGTSKKDGQTEANGQQAMSGDLTEGQELVLARKQQKVAERLANIEAGYDYKSEILHFEKRESQENQAQTSSRIQEVLIEIKQLSSSVKELEVEVKDISMDRVPAKAGKYHEGFFDYLLTIIRNARLRVENSADWMHAVAGKKAKKGYWDSAKKHGTSYTLASDRVVSQQVG